MAEFGRIAAGGAFHPIQRQIPQRLDAQMAADLLEGMARGYQLGLGRCVDAVIAGTGDRRRGDAEMNFFPASTSRTGLNLIFTLALRAACVGLMNVRPT